jgi:hypothetical protein
MPFVIQTTDTRASVLQSEVGTVYDLTKGELGTLKALEGRWHERIEVIDGRTWMQIRT